MEALLYAFWRILRLRDEPHVIPASVTLLGLVLLVHASVGFLLALFSMSAGFALLYALVSTLTMTGVVHGLLLLFGRQNRYMQSLTALAGCEALLGVFLIPVSLLFFIEGGENLRGFLAIFSLLLMGWNVALAAHVFRHALGVSAALGFFYSIVYLIIAITLGDVVSAAGVTHQ